MNSAHVYQPSTLQELAELLQARPQAMLLGGGTLAIPSWYTQGALQDVIYLPALAELCEMHTHFCGAAVTLARISSISSTPAALREAAASIAGPAVRNLATLGGNLASQSTRCLAVALLVLNAEVERLENPSTSQTVHRRLDEALEGPLGAIISVHWNMPAGASSTFLKLGLRATGGPNLCSVAIRWDGPKNPAGCAIAVGSTGTRPHRVTAAEELWAALAHDPIVAARATKRVASDHALVADDGIADISYRRHVVGVLVERALLKLVKQSESVLR